MTEAVGGKVGLAGLEVKEGFVAFRFLREKSELRKAVMNEKAFKEILKRLHKDENKGNLDKFVKDEEDGLKHVVKIMDLMTTLLSHLTYDLEKVKMTLVNVEELDREEIEKGMAEEGPKLDKEAKTDIMKMNEMLRNISDRLGALAKK